MNSFLGQPREGLRENTEWDGLLYESNSNLQIAGALTFYQRHYDFKGGEVIFDVGCGSGQLSALLCKKLRPGKGELWGIDRSVDMLKVAQEKYGPAEYPHLKFLQCEVENLNQLTMPVKADLILSSYCLHWLKLEDLKVFSRWAQNSLAPGGQVMTVFADLGHYPMLEEALQLAHSPKWKELMPSFDFNYFQHEALDFENLFRSEAAFSYVKAELVDHDFLFESVEAFKGWVEAWIPHMRQLESKALQQEFMEELTWTFLKKNPSMHLPGGRVHFRDKHIHTVARL